jgi:hypothetical protein
MKKQIGGKQNKLQKNRNRNQAVVASEFDNLK